MLTKIVAKLIFLISSRLTVEFRCIDNIVWVVWELVNLPLEASEKVTRESSKVDSSW